jgi:hypothetical protein
MKTKEVIGFRLPEQGQMQTFERLVGELEVKPSDLAREAFLLGLPQAAEKIKLKKLKETQSLLERLQALSATVITSSRLRLRNQGITC